MAEKNSQFPLVIAHLLDVMKRAYSQSAPSGFVNIQLNR